MPRMSAGLEAQNPLSVMSSIHPYPSLCRLCLTVLLEQCIGMCLSYRLKSRPHKCEVDQGMKGFPFPLLQAMQTLQKAIAGWS